MWDVMISISLLTAVMMLVNGQMGERGEQFADVQVGGQMNRSVIELEGEEDRHARRTPPTRPRRRALQTMLAALNHGEQAAA